MVRATRLSAPFQRHKACVTLGINIAKEYITERPAWSDDRYRFLSKDARVPIAFADFMRIAMTGPRAAGSDP